jgi:hypothetical protein
MIERTRTFFVVPMLIMNHLRLLCKTTLLARVTPLVWQHEHHRHPFPDLLIETLSAACELV